MLLAPLRWAPCKWKPIFFNSNPWVMYQGTTWPSLFAQLQKCIYLSTSNIGRGDIKARKYSLGTDHRQVKKSSKSKTPQRANIHPRSQITWGYRSIAWRENSFLWPQTEFEQFLKDGIDNSNSLGARDRPDLGTLPNQKPGMQGRGITIYGEVCTLVSSPEMEAVSLATGIWVWATEGVHSGKWKVFTLSWNSLLGSKEAEVLIFY